MEQRLLVETHLALFDNAADSEHSQCLEQLEVLEGRVNASEPAHAHERKQVEPESPCFHIVAVDIIRSRDFVAALVLVRGEEHQDQVDDENYVNEEVDSIDYFRLDEH